MNLYKIHRIYCREFGMEIFTKIKAIRLQNDREWYVLNGNKEGSLYLPLFYPNLYITMERRGQDASTIKQVLNAIRFLYAWGVREDIDFEKRIRSLEFLTNVELYNLKESLLLHYPYLESKAEQKLDARTGTQKKVVQLTKPELVEDSTFNTRLGFVKSYLGWLGKFATDRLTEAEKTEHEKNSDKMVTYLEKFSISAPERPAGEPLSTEQERLLYEVIDPDSPRNVWAPNVRLRNYLIIKTYLNTGVRRAELMSFYANDLKAQDKKIELIDRSNDPKDSRKRKAEVKTIGRTLPLDPRLTQELSDYRLSSRAEKRGNPFLFTTGRGTPISHSAMENVFKKLRRIPELKELTPHVLRYTFANNLYAHFVENGHNQDFAKDYINTLLGWSKSSKMNLKYTANELDKIVAKMAMKRQEMFERDNKK